MMALVTDPSLKRRLSPIVLSERGVYCTLNSLLTMSTVQSIPTMGRLDRFECMNVVEGRFAEMHLLLDSLVLRLSESTVSWTS